MTGRGFGPALAALSILACGCATAPGPMTERPGAADSLWSSLTRASASAIRDPAVWGSLAAAAALQIDDADRQISDELRAHTPLFGSAADANAASDDWRGLTSLALAGSALAVPVDAGVTRVDSRPALLGAEWLAVQSTRWVTSGLKAAAGRERPNGRNDESLPSGHTSRASVQAHLAAMNLERADLAPGLRSGLTWAVHGSAALTGWARVEAGQHYPADVLVGWALGRFMGLVAEELIFSGPATLVVRPAAGPGVIYVGAEFVFR